MRIKKANAILKCPVNKFFTTEYTYHDTNQTDKARKQKLGQEAAVIDELKRKYDCYLLVRFNKTWEIFPRVTRVLGILLTTAATSPSVESVEF